MSDAQMREVVVARVSLMLRVLSVPIAIAFVLIGLYLIPTSIQGMRDVFWLILIGGGAGFYLWLSTDSLRLKIIIDEVEIRRRGIIERRLLFSEIHTVKFDSGCITVYGKGGSIMLSKVLDRQQEAMDAVGRALYGRHDLRIVGDSEMAEAYLGRSTTKRP